MDLVTLAVAKKYTDKAIVQAAVGDIDVEAYVKEEIDKVVGNATDSFDTLAEIETSIKNKVDKVSGKGLSTNDFTAAYKNKVDAAVPNTLTINGKALSGNITLSAADVKALPSTTTIPTTLANLTEDSTHRVVTDAEKTVWNAKSNFSGSYNDLTDKPTIPSISGLATTDYVDGAVANIILTSEGGKKFKLVVADDGTLTASEVTE
jgi:hypothetical protein